MTAEVVLHLSTPDLTRYRGKQSAGLFALIHDRLRAQGARVRLVKRQNQQIDGSTLKSDRQLHIVETGWCYGRGWLSAATAYFPGFWHLSEEGVLADSPAKYETFEADLIERSQARPFAKALRAQFSGQRVTRYHQERLERQVLPKGAIGVFLQGPAVYRREQAFVPAPQMLRVVARHAGGRPVVVKAHPLSQDFGRAAIAKVRSEGFDLIETEANVHDILAACAVTVSVNSAVAFEGFLHRVPAILFGRSDFHSLTETVLDDSEYPQALSRALAREWDYSKMLYWYFDRHTLWTEAPDFDARLLAVLAKAGFGAERLGLL